MISRFLSASLVSVACMVAPALAADEMIDNPEYKMWAQFKAGTSVVTKMVSENAGQKTEMETKTTLKEVTKEKCVVESAMSMNAGGTKMDMPAQARDVPAQFPKPKTEGEVKEEPKPETKEGAETVKVGDKEFKCKWIETTVKIEGGKSISKVWTCDEFPGGTVKMENKMEGATPSTTTMIATEVSIKK